MQTYLVQESASDAWLSAAQLLCAKGNCVGLHVVIQKPCNTDPVVIDALDDVLKLRKRISTKHVAATIFPEGLWRKDGKGDPDRLFSLYNKSNGYFQRLERRRKLSNHNDWGTYFQRLSADGFTGRGKGQLSLAIQALKRDAKPAGAIHLHTGLPQDGIRKIGGPCLQIITIHAERHPSGHQLSACALYRNHDFFEKALGNYIGLGNLLAFLASSVGMRTGMLHVISGHAYCTPKRPIIALLNSFNV